MSGYHGFGLDFGTLVSVYRGFGVSRVGIFDPIQSAGLEFGTLVSGYHGFGHEFGILVSAYRGFGALGSGYRGFGVVGSGYSIQNKVSGLNSGHSCRDITDSAMNSGSSCRYIADLGLSGRDIRLHAKCRPQILDLRVGISRIRGPRVGEIAIVSSYS